MKPLLDDQLRLLRRDYRLGLIKMPKEIICTKEDVDNLNKYIGCETVWDGQEYLGVKIIVK